MHRQRGYEGGNCVGIGLCGLPSLFLHSLKIEDSKHCRRDRGFALWMSFLVKHLLKSAVGQAATGREGQPSSHAPTHHDRPPAGPSYAATVRQLMLRIVTCSVPQDRRDALKELSVVPELGRFMTGEQVASLLEVAKQTIGSMDNDTPRTVLEILAIATDPTTNNGPNRESLVQQLLDVPFFMGFFDDASFWSRYHAVQILQRLEEVDANSVHRQLLDTHGLHAVIDVLNDNSNGGALRNEGLVLLSALTATDQELQTIIAFENGFDSLFEIVMEEGGLTGGVVVTDCLSTVLNMLRGNNATQKFFREMGCGRSVAQLLSSVAPSVAQVGSADSRVEVESFDEALSPDSSIALQRCVAIVQCLVKGADANNESTAIRNAMLHAGAVPPLATVAFSNSRRVDTSTQVEALRTLALLLHKSKGCTDAFAQARISVKISDQTPWSSCGAAWAVVRTLLTSTDGTIQSACMSIVASVIECSSSSVSAASLFVKNLSKANGTVPVPTTDQQHCGYLVACGLYGCFPATAVAPTSMYFAAVVLQHVVTIPQLTEQMLHIPWDGSTFFVSYVRHVISVIHHKQTDLCTIAALMRPIFTWLMYSAKAVGYLLQDEGTFSSFLDWGFQTRDAVPTRFLSLMLAAAIITAAPAANAPALKPKANAAMDKQMLLNKFLDRTNHLKKLEDLINDVSQSSDWKLAPVSAAASSTPVLFDEGYRLLLLDIHKNIQALCPAPHSPTSSSSPPSEGIDRRPPLVPSPPLPNHGSESQFPATIQDLPASLQHAVNPVVPLMRSASPSRGTPLSPRFSAAPDASEAREERWKAATEEAQAIIKAQTDELESLRKALAGRDADVHRVRTEAELEVNKYRHECEALHAQLVASLAKQSALEAQHLDTTQLLEEALHGKEEEARALASSLSMLENRLQNSMLDLQQASEIKGMLEVAEEERDELLIMVAEMEEEREYRRDGGNASGISPPRTLTDVDVSPQRRGLHSDVE